MKEIIIVATVIVLGIGLFSGVGISLDYWLSKKRCLAAYENYQPEYALFSHCRVMWNGKLTPTDVIREIN